MLAAVLEDVRRMVLKDMPAPEPGPGEVVVKMKACGICQTDFSAYTGRRRNWRKGSILGHEMSGVVAARGPGIRAFREGDPVIVSPAAYCGQCVYCKRGLQHYCPNGWVIGGEGFETVWDGGFAEYVKAPLQALYYKPEGISFGAAALTEPLGGSYKGMIEYSDLRVTEDVVVIGAGGMGLLLTQVAYAAGAGRLIVIDIVDFKLDLARECGATHVINSAKMDPKKAVYDILPDGPDVVFEAAGVLEAATLTFDLCRRGTRINMFGVIIPGTIPVSPADIHFTEIRMDASFSVTPAVLLRSIRLMETGLCDPEKIISHRIPLDEIHEALRVMETPERVKVVVTM